MRKLARQAVIAGASALTVMCAVGGADLQGQARADDPQCVANAADPCPPQADPPQGRPAPGGPAAASDCLHGGGPKTGGESLLASASTRGAPMAAIEPAPERNSIELSRWLSPRRGAAWPSPSVRPTT